MFVIVDYLLQQTQRTHFISMLQVKTRVGKINLIDDITIEESEM